MSWFAVDDKFHNHRKVLRLRRSKHYSTALALWTLAGSWCTAQEQERFTGQVPLDVLATFGLPDWFEATEALVNVTLWERPDDEHIDFHDWDEWNGIGGKEYRSKEQTRLRQQAHRKKKCDSGKHDRHCPSETCPKKADKEAGNGGSRDPGSGRVGTGRVGTSAESKATPTHTDPAEPPASTSQPSTPNTDRQEGADHHDPDALFLPRRSA